MRAARRLPRRPDRRRPRRPAVRGGRRRRRRHDPDLQRRLPRPAAAADGHRGLGHDRGAAGAARRARGRHPRDRRPGAGQARGGRRRRARRPDASTPAPVPQTSTRSCSPTGCAARRRAAAPQVRLAYYVPARDERSDRVVDPRGVVTAGGLTYLDAWCHSAEAPRLFRLDRIAEAEVLDSAVITDPVAPRDLAAGLFDRSDGPRTAHPAPGRARPVGHRVLPGRRRPHRGAAAAGRGRPPGRRRAVADPAAAAPGAARRGGRAGRAGRAAHRRRTGRARPLSAERDRVR